MSSVSPSSSASQAVVPVQTFEQFAGLVSLLELLPEAERAAALNKSLSACLSAYHAYLRKLGSASTPGSVASSEVSSSSAGLSQVSYASKGVGRKGKVGRWFSSRKLPGVPVALVTKRMGELPGKPSEFGEKRLELPVNVVRLNPGVVGFCYLEAFIESEWCRVGSELGPSPSFFSLLSQPTHSFSNLWDPELVLSESGSGLHLSRGSRTGEKFWEVMAALAVRSRPMVTENSVWHVLKDCTSFVTERSPSMGVGASGGVEMNQLFDGLPSYDSVYGQDAQFTLKQRLFMASVGAEFPVRRFFLGKSSGFQRAYEEFRQYCAYKRFQFPSLHEGLTDAQLWAIFFDVFSAEALNASVAIDQYKLVDMQVKYACVEKSGVRGLLIDGVYCEIASRPVFKSIVGTDSRVYSNPGAIIPQHRGQRARVVMWTTADGKSLVSNVRWVLP